ncbi:ABC-type dipeptide/oligopeptide/nickel transport system, permease component [Halovivax ruber XH-70]|uniref:ABC-type dipeptide/oligopeptide/nickel transport system, permease component n=1 Tax=Halovivax ruber (strain DSM 18193 / JCM 13892 / XH-70) TaxID=797302 RepID=L0IA52_HALRX|nr:ABC transporter permease [Halovivax ruber]AGB15708.1 ABC-type dipeptide/oligopeptide/nickel transport system, permease component [Halovivax ruber XH-70]
MSVQTDNTAANASTREEDTTLRERIRQNPRPATIWFAGLALLILLEFPKVIAGISAIGGVFAFVLDIALMVPDWIGGNVGGGAISFVVHDLVAIGLLFVASIFVSGYILPWHVAERFDLDVTRRGSIYLDRAVATGILAAIAGILAFTPIGALLSNELSLWSSILDSLTELPSLTDRELISNQGYRSPDGSGWEGTFLGLEPKLAWMIRVGVVYAYAFAFLGWLWKGYNVFRDHYRAADWTPRDDTLRRFRNHTWGLFGLVVVIMFLVLAVWAPTISPVTAEANIYSTYEHEVTYLGDDGTLETVTHGVANLDSQSRGNENVGIWSYDDYGRWQPFGTTPHGQNLMTHLAYGAQTSLIIGVLAIGLGGLIAVLLSLVTAYYKGVADVITVIASDTIISIPLFLLVMMLSVIFNEGDHWLAEPMDGGLLLALIFAFAYWPGLWRSIRGPSLQVSEEEWVDAAKSYGQTPLKTMRKHMAPYIAGYIMIYASLIVGGVIIATSALSFLGLGINPPTPEWGRLIADGRQYVSGPSWHIATVSGIMIVLVVTAFNALGDGIRDAIDPEADVGGDGGAAAGGGG